MTDLLEKHKYRCENCDHWDNYAFPSEWICNKIKQRLNITEINMIMKTGCASHSDVKNEFTDLLYPLRYGYPMTLPKFLEWLAKRMVEVYHEDKNMEFIQSCSVRAMLCQEAIDKYG